MSIFRKPTKKIQRRVFTADDDDDDGEPEPPPPPVISRSKKENKPAVAKIPHLLSFADEEEEEEVEVFKVKKSSQSKRLAKRKEKKRREADGDGFNSDVADTEAKPELAKSKTGKKVTLEGLILSGRDAVSASGGGDVSDSGDSAGSADERGFHKYRAEAVRTALAGSAIPDAALIHAARKTRQQARELGDYVPLRNNGEGAAERPAGPGSRLMREDGSGDDEEEGPLRVVGLELPSDKPKRGTAAEPTNEELDSESEQWEEQQLHKAVPAIGDICDIELNPFASAPPPPRLDDAPAHLRPLISVGEPAPADASQLCTALDKRLNELEVQRSELLAKSEELRDRLLTASRIRESRSSRRGQMDKQYRRAQAARGYLTDLIECLDEKIPEIEALEARALALHKKRCEFLIERRRADVRDQAQDVMAAPASRVGAPRSADDEEKIRRTAEREGRRRARRLQREAANCSADHREGDSSDDELSPSEAHRHQAEREEILQASAAVFSDALGAFGTARGVLRKLSRWRRAAPTLYSDAYIADFLPRLLAPYVRHQLILWNPLADEDNEDYEKMDWYKCAMMYGVKSSNSGSESDSDADDEVSITVEVTEKSVREDQDLMLVPNLVAKVVVPKLTELVEAAWDPMCVRSTVRLRGLLLRASGVAPRKLLTPLAQAVASRLEHALRADVMLPAPSAVIGPAGEVFWRRCLGAGVRLLRSCLALTPPPPVLHARARVKQLVDMLCTMATSSDGRRMATAAAAITHSLPRTGVLRACCLARVAVLASAALKQLSDNPVHLKSIEQARAIIAEAKAANENSS